MVEKSSFPFPDFIYIFLESFLEPNYLLQLLTFSFFFVCFHFNFCEIHFHILCYAFPVYFPLLEYIGTRKKMSSSTEPSPNSKPFNLLLPVQVPMVDSIEGSEEASAWWAVQRVVFQLFSIGVKQFLSECQNRQRKGSFQKS